MGRNFFHVATMMPFAKQTSAIVDVSAKSESPAHAVIALAFPKMETYHARLPFTKP